MSMSLLPEERPDGYGFAFGYAGYCTDVAIKTDNPAMLAECIERGFIDETSTMLDNTTIAGQCEKRGWAKCAAMLSERGWK